MTYIFSAISETLELWIITIFLNSRHIFDDVHPMYMISKINIDLAFAFSYSTHFCV
jgi:hypothetical protein